MPGFAQGTSKQDKLREVPALPPSTTQPAFCKAASHFQGQQLKQLLPGALPGICHAPHHRRSCVFMHSGRLYRHFRLGSFSDLGCCQFFPFTGVLYQDHVSPQPFLNHLRHWRQYQMTATSLGTRPSRPSLERDSLHRKCIQGGNWAK